MIFSDSLGHLLNEIKKGQNSRKIFIIARKSKFIINVLNKLVAEGFIFGFNIYNKYYVKVYLKYNVFGKPLIFNITRVSKISCRCFIRAYQVKKYLKPMDNCVFFLTTSVGIITNKEAILRKIGGEVLFKINN